jgi:hypothetical protein
MVRVSRTIFYFLNVPCYALFASVTCQNLFFYKQEFQFEMQP